jgi:nitrogen fixation/metabolism regulation signal transduction histidine kinase
MPAASDPASEAASDPGTEHRRRLEARRGRVSLAGKITAGFFVLMVLVAGLAAVASRIPDVQPLVVFLGILVVALPLGAWLIGSMLRPLDRVVRGVSDGIRSFRDQDFSVRLAYQRDDELGDLVRHYNEVSRILQDERHAVRQRELLLQTALDSSPAAILLVNSIGRIIYSNREARRLLTGGAKLDGRSFDELRAGCPKAMREILASETDGLFTVPGEAQSETYHLGQRRFQLNRRLHRLVLLRRLTGELGRQEAETWKKVIRVISHELNNSLAPVSSLVHSAQQMSREPQHAARLGDTFASIRERLQHLRRFIEGYARFARLPAPRRERVEWDAFLAGFGEYFNIEIVGGLPTAPAYFDPAQMRQVVQNLLKNAIEAGFGDTPVRLRVQETRDGTYLQVIDRGLGMDAETMEKALLPFYSTKKSGTGLGLPLCREILEAHGGKISLQGNDEGGTIVTCWLPPGP